MRKTKQALLLLLATCYWLLATNGAFAQEVTKFPIKDSAITIVGSGEGTPFLTPTPGPDPGPSVFKPPFKCEARYVGFTYNYPDQVHSSYSVDFNRYPFGVDDRGDLVRASADGIVRAIIWSNGEVFISHDGGYGTLYAHMQSIGNYVRVYDRVKLGQKIGEISDIGQATGSHLHASLYKNGYRVKLTYNNVPYPASIANPPCCRKTWGPVIRGQCP